VFYLTKVKINEIYKDETVGCAWTQNTNAKVNKLYCIFGLRERLLLHMSQMRNLIIKSIKTENTT
jgi:hypothetical protein